MATMDYSNYFGADKNVRVVTRVVPESTEIAAGEIVNKGVNSGEIAKIGQTPNATDAYGIAIEDAKTAAGETASIAVLVNGCFNADKVIYPTGKTISDYEIPLRNIGIILQDVINTQITR